ncbi:ATP-grasp domain-containing protein [Candidatus Saccharibacteria bacterium]|nr:ATP-grasp domain-containing protein [Candidatus Saccharibacteria bacterium]
MRIAIIGKNFSGLRKYMAEKNVDFVLFKDSTQNHADTDTNTKHVDFSKKELVFDAVAHEHEKNPFDATVTLYEQYILITAEIAEKLSINGLPVDAARACTNKSIMRTLFANAPRKISPQFQVVESESDLKAFANTHSFPLILKPANLAKSLLVTRNNTVEELLRTYKKMLEKIEPVYQKYAPHNERIVLVEEFLEGSIHSVDAFVDGKGNPTVLPHIVDYQTGYDIGYDDNFHYSRILPSKLSSDTQKDFIETAEIAIKSLGMKNCAAHVEIIVTEDGPRVVEIGARNGGYRERMHKLAQGIDIYDNLFLAITDSTLDIAAKKDEPCAVLELFPKKTGVFSHVENEESLRSLPSLNYISIKYKPGDIAGKSADGYKAACVICLHNEDAKQFENDLEFVNSQVFVVTQS